MNTKSAIVLWCLLFAGFTGLGFVDGWRWRDWANLIWLSLAFAWVFGMRWSDLRLAGRLRSLSPDEQRAVLDSLWPQRRRRLRSMLGLLEERSNKPSGGNSP